VRDSGAHTRRVSRRAVAIVAGVALGALLTASLASAGSTWLYAIGKRSCTSTSPKVLTCNAMRRVMVAAGTPGAQPFTPGAGATGSGTLGPNGGLTPGDLAKAYAVNTTAVPATTQTIAIVDAYKNPNIAADLTHFDTQYALATCTIANGCLRIVNQTGGATLPAADTTGWSQEETLDVQAAHAICQHCKIVLIEANSPSNSDFTIAENTAVNTIHATEVSNSFGEPEQYTGATMQAAFNHPGTVIVASSGDDGYFDFDKLGGSGLINHPQIPAAYPTVVAVGGTSLLLGQTAVRQNESVWNDNGFQDYAEYLSGYILGAGGGGCSSTFAAQAWQTNTTTNPNWAKTACGTHRLVADVSAIADYLTGFDIYDSYNCGSACGGAGWMTFGGTSLAAPVIAAMFGLAGGSHGVSYPAQTLYSHASSAYDVKFGGNGWCMGIGAAGCPDPNLYGYGIMDCAYTSGGVTAAGNAACDATTGYDGPSGVGSPKTLAMFTP
jgi:subtilase family serine protease